jgi:putative ABC transport system permease protein
VSILSISRRIRPRWAKVLSDIWGNKVRLVLVVASIAIGLFAVGMISSMNVILTNDIVTSYQKVNPANIFISVEDCERKEADGIKNIPGISGAESARSFSVRVNSGTDAWTRINVKAIPDIDKMNINRVNLLQGKWPPKDKEIVFDQHKLADANIHLGDWIEVMLPDGTKKQMHFVGIVRDQSIGSGLGGGYFAALLQGYVTYDSLDWFNQPEKINQVFATVSDQPNDLDHIQSLTDKVIDKLEKNEHLVINQASRAMDEHPNKVYAEAIGSILYALGFLVVFLSAFLITNTLNALLNQQFEQIGVIKTLGGRRNQIIAIYLVLILVYSVIGLAISLALSGRAAYAL